MLLMMRILALLALVLVPLHMAGAMPIQPDAAHHDMGAMTANTAVDCCGSSGAEDHGFCQMPAALPRATQPLRHSTTLQAPARATHSAQRHGRSLAPDLRPPIPV